ncbi:TPA: hypothetical protein JD264_24770 [Serratia fonticola]|nr:hypothetical protein [Serratia fonticola]
MVGDREKWTIPSLFRCFIVFFTPLSVDNIALILRITGSYPNNNPCCFFQLCISGHLDPSLYGSGSPIIHSKRSSLILC